MLATGIENMTVLSPVSNLTDLTDYVWQGSDTHLNNHSITW